MLATQRYVFKVYTTQHLGSLCLDSDWLHLNYRSIGGPTFRLFAPQPTSSGAAFLLVSQQASKKQLQSSKQPECRHCLCCTGTRVKPYLFSFSNLRPNPPQQESILSLVTLSLNLRTAPPTARRTVGGTG